MSDVGDVCAVTVAIRNESLWVKYGCYATDNKTIKLLNHARNSHASAPEYKYLGVITTITTQNLIG